MHEVKQTPQSKTACESIVYIPKTLRGDSEWISKWTLSPKVEGGGFIYSYLKENFDCLQTFSSWSILCNKSCDFC